MNVLYILFCLVTKDCLFSIELQRHQKEDGITNVPGADVTQEMKDKLSPPKIFDDTCKVENLIEVLEEHARCPGDGFLNALFVDNDVFTEFATVCLLPTVTVSRMNNIGRYGTSATGGGNRSFFDVVTKYDIAFAMLILDDRYRLFEEIAKRKNEEINITYYMQREMEGAERMKFGNIRSKECRKFTLYTSGGDQAASDRGWSKGGVERFNCHVLAIDKYMNDNLEDYKALDEHMTAFWLEKDENKISRKRKFNNGEKAEGGICSVQAQCGL